MSPLRATVLVFGPDGEVLPVRYLWALLVNGAVMGLAGWLLSGDEPNDLGDE
jgi:hypothetical protein